MIHNRKLYYNLIEYFVRKGSKPQILNKMNFFYTTKNLSKGYCMLNQYPIVRKIIKKERIWKYLSCISLLGYS